MKKSEFEKNVVIFKKIIEKYKNELIDYWQDETQKRLSLELINSCIINETEIIESRINLINLIPDSDDDGSWRCSYAICVGSIIFEFREYLTTKSKKHLMNAFIEFYNLIDFKVNEIYEKSGETTPTEEQIRTHELYIQEKSWLEVICNE